mmetsp:Transcript_16840/g.18776  ORF Transcript_16840/g.18776 Transcript_16840/m.18776 type:complete len:93 (+) Transcript_16840:423-701(+)
MCDELGPKNEFMQEFVMEAGGTSLCDAETLAGCSEKEQKYITKFKAKSHDDVQAQITRLTGMKGGKMRDELKKWLNQRLAILTQLPVGKEEL